MKYIYIIVVFLFSISGFSQTTETFETETDGSQSFTDGGQVFNITTQTADQTFKISNYSGKGWNGTAADNKFIDNSGSAFYENVQFTISSATQAIFKLKSLYLFLSQTDLTSGIGNCTIVGKLKGVTKFTAIAASDFNSSVTNNGFTLMDLANYGGSDNSNIIIDEFIISTTGNFEYVALDAMKWVDVCASLTTTSSQINVSCNGGSNGSASVNVTGGTPGYTYLWAPSGGTAATATGLSAGMYTVTVTDANGCTATKNFTVLQPTALVVTPTAQTNIACNGGANGSATVTVFGGTPGYTYSWAPSGGTAATATGLSAGTYTVTVTDANGCIATQSFNIVQPTALVATVGAQTNVSCNGGANGSATVNVAGGIAGYTYSWSPSGGTAATATSLSAGTYTVTVTDSNMCQTTQSFTITEPTALVASAGAKTNVSCNGGSNGSATVNVAGGIAGYTYSWAPSGGTAATATGLSAGMYTVTVTDANGCIATQSFTITQPTTLVASPSAQTNIACNGGSNGSATVNVTGGTPGYTYSWAPSGGTAATATGLSAGTYTVTVTDANGCIATQSFNIVQPTALVVTVGAQTNVSCNGGANGSATVNVAGSIAGYTYSWAPSGGTAATATGLSAGTYTVTVTDANGCIATQSFNIVQPTALVATVGAQTNVSCNGGANGSATVNVAGGIAGYTYSWAPSGGTAATATGLSAGTYTVTVTDSNMCQTTQSFTITEPTALVASAGSKTNVSCNGGSNGSATVNVSGGTSVYTYSWAPAGGTASTATGLSAGMYTVTVTDANGCIATQSFTITQPTTLVASPSAQTNIACNGGSNGSATVNVIGGTPGYTYSWAPTGGTAAAATGLSAGIYTVTVTDANGCAVNQSFTITEPDLLSFTTPSLLTYDYNEAYNEAIVATGGTGLINYAVTSGSLPSGFSLDSNGLITGSSTKIADSDFSVTGIDVNGCEVVKDFVLRLNQLPITVTANAMSKVYGTSDPVLTYSFSPSLLPSDNFSGELSREEGEDVGFYTISLGTLSAGSKYIITFESNDFDIVKADQAIVWSQTLGLGCDGESTTVLTATSSSGLPIDYTSSDNDIVTISGNMLNFENYGSATITASQLGNANYNAAPIVVLPAVSSQPNLIRKQFDNIIFFDNSSKEFVAFSWYKNGVLVPNQTAQYFKENGVLDGVYYAKARRVDGKLITSCSLTLSPSVEEEYLKIAPNPVGSNSVYQISTNVALAKLQNAHIMVFNMLGTMMSDKIISQNTVDMLAPSAEGIYIVRMILANGQVFSKNLLVKN